MQGKYQRTEDISFLGTKYKTFKCTKCGSKSHDIGLNKTVTVCPPCANMTLQDHLDANMDYSKSFDECFKDQARLTREYNDTR